MSRNARRVGIWVLTFVVAVAAGAATRGAWWPPLRARLLSALGAAPDAGASAAHADEHDDHDHAHAGHDELNSIALSTQAQANIGLKLGAVTTTTFERTITIPGMIAERPGRSTTEVTAPLSGVVTRIHVIQGEAVRPGQKLFELRLTHEELVQAQVEFLRLAEELDVIEREIKRLDQLVAEGGIAARQVLERRYEQQTKQAVLRAQHQALLLHGLDEAHIQTILGERKLLRDLAVSVPAAEPDGAASGDPRQVAYQVRDLDVERGQSVAAGATMARLTDHSELFIEGNAFDKDVDAIGRAVEEDWSVTALVEGDEPRPDVLRDLKILYVAGSVDPETRAFHFYVRLPNELTRDAEAHGHRFVNWRYKPGQRVQLLVPVERWTDQIVLPIDAVAQDGVETYVFLPNGDHFDRKPVHVEHRDRLHAVIAGDGAIFPGDALVVSGAQQLQLALKNNSGAAVDPHAGHNH